MKHLSGWFGTMRQPASTAICTQRSVQVLTPAHVYSYQLLAVIATTSAKSVALTTSKVIRTLLV